MTDELERLIGNDRYGDDGRLDGLEDKVWARVSERRNQVRTGLLRIAVVALALVVGLTNGGLLLLSPRPEPSEMRIFTVSAGLSPLSGLDVRG